MCVKDHGRDVSRPFNQQRHCLGLVGNGSTVDSVANATTPVIRPCIQPIHGYRTQADQAARESQYQMVSLQL